MSIGGQIGSEFQTFDFTHDRRTYEVFRGGAGPAVLVLHEIPGLAVMTRAVAELEA